jgi:hypothetical protein
MAHQALAGRLVGACAATLSTAVTITWREITT